MNDYLSNLSARSFDRTEDISFVSPRLPALFESQQDLWIESVGMSSRPLVNHLPNDESLHTISEEASKEPTNLERSHDKYVGMDIKPPTEAEDFSRFHLNSMESLRATPEDSPRDNKPADIGQAVHGKRAVIKLPALSIPSENSPIEQPVRNQAPGEAKTKETTHAIADQNLPRSGGEGRIFSGRLEQEERSTRLPFDSRKEYLVVEDVRLKEHVERIFERDHSSVSEVEESHKVIKPSIKQLPPQHVVEPIFTSLQKYDQRATPAKQEPAIQVTIGRIEVRAVTQPVTKRPKPKGKPLMSLDGYLRGRNGGGQ